VASTLNPAAPAGTQSRDRFIRFAWGVLVYNIFVVLWGALVRATHSGAGCGNHWPLCNGEVVPFAPAVETVIEFTHRITSGLALAGVVLLLVWSVRLFERGHRVRRYAVLSVVFIVVEALLGAGLVLLEYVDQNKSIGRAFYLSAHLANTMVLLGVLALTAWYARPEAPATGRWARWSMLAGSLPVVLIVGISGAIAALGDTLFPATSLAEGIRQEMSTTAHFLLRLRVFHPALAICAAVYISLAAQKVIKTRTSPIATKLAWMVWGLVILQLLVGGLNVVLLAPVWMQIVHLLLTDLLWVVLVLLVVEGSATRELPSASGI
jgi:heme a synthase